MADNGWTEYTLGEVTESLDSKRAPVKKPDRRAGPYPYYGASGVVDHVDKFIFDGEYLLIAEDGENLRSRKTPIAFIANGQFWVNNHAHIVRGNRLANTRFIAYAIERMNISGFLTGSTMPKLTQGSMNQIRLRLPPRPVQDSIVDLAQSLDDKIELNRRMNKTLEAMARAIFKSWFVDFDPVRAKLDGRQPPGMDADTAALFPDGFEHTDDGIVPRGWQETNLGEVIEIHDSKRIPLSGRERAQRQGPYPYHGAASVMDYVDDYLFDGIYVLMGEDGSVVNDDGSPVMQYAWGQFWVNNHAHVLRGRNGVSSEHLLLHLRQSNIAPFVTGAVQPKLNQRNMKQMEFMLPTKTVCAAFDEAVSPLFAQYRNEVEESKTLAATRDALLPKMLSGEIRVADAEKVVEQTV